MMKKARNVLLPEMVLHDFAHQRTASIASKNAYQHLESILNITKYISNSNLVNVKVQNLNEKENFEHKPSQPSNVNNDFDVLDSIPSKRSGNITASSHSNRTSKIVESGQIINQFNHNEQNFINKMTENFTKKSNIYNTEFPNSNEDNTLHSPILTSISSKEELIDQSQNNIGKKVILTTTISSIKENIIVYKDRSTKSDRVSASSDVSNTESYNDYSSSAEEYFDIHNQDDTSYKTDDKISSTNNQRKSLNAKEYHKVEYDSKIASTSSSYDSTTLSSNPQVHASEANFKSNFPSEQYVPTVKSDIENLKDTFAQNPFVNDEKPILTQNNVSFYFNDISSSVIISVGLSFAFALLLFFLTVLWIIKRKKFHSKVYLSYELAKPCNRPISKPLRPMPPSILPGEAIFDNQSVSEIESPREPLFLQEERFVKTMNKRLSGSMENCDSGIDNPAYIGASTSEDITFGKQGRPTLKMAKKEITRTRRAAPKYLKKRKSGADFPPRVCSSDGSIFPASPSLTRCLVPPPPYSPSIRKESKLIFTLPTGNNSNSLNIDCESSH